MNEDVKQYLSYTCNECGAVQEHPPSYSTVMPMCDECGSYLGEPDGGISVFTGGQTKGFFECFDCGHTFGYADNGIENNTGTDIMCPNCSSDNVAKI